MHYTNVFCWPFHLFCWHSISQSSYKDWFVEFAMYLTTYLIDELISHSTDKIAVIWWIVLALANQCLNLGTDMIVFCVELVASFSSPMQISQHHTVSNHDSLKIQLLSWRQNFIFVLDQQVSQQRNIHPAVWLSSNPEFVSFIFWE